MKLDFSKEDLVGSPVKISDGAWVFGALHHPGLANKNMRVSSLLVQKILYSVDKYVLTQLLICVHFIFVSL